MSYLLDTNVVSEMRKIAEGKADPSIALWAGRQRRSSLFLSAVTILEIEIGSLRLARRDQRQGAMLRRWLEDKVLVAFAGRILPVDLAVARRCASLHVPDPRSERDAMIAATALVHGLTVVTRNRADFAPTGVTILDPWEYAAAGS